MNKIIFITIIIIILTGGAFFLFKSGFGKREALSNPTPQVESVVKVGISPTPTLTPIPAKLDYKMDLKKELESVNPQVLDSDFENLNNLISLF